MSDELPEVTCPNCDMTFSVIFNRNPDYEGIEFCPFCGEEWYGEELDDDDE